MIYLDYCATTPVDSRVLEAMLPYFSGLFGNAASQHRFGQIAGEAVERAREQVGNLLKCAPSDVIWTSGATESNNLAIKGAVRSLGRSKSHVITQATEHKAALDPIASLGNEGVAITILDVDSRGIVQPDDVRRAIRPDTAVVSIMAANNEVGTIQPIGEIAAVCQQAGVVFHTDASQAVGKIPLDFGRSQIDLLSLSGHKIYGPKGVGALVFRRGPKLRRLHPMIDGGGHERGFRSGTLNVPAIVGLGSACEIYVTELPIEQRRIEGLRDTFESILKERLPSIIVNAERALRLANVSNVAFLGIDAESLVLALDEVAASTGSACTAASLEPSHVLRAMKMPEVQQLASVRFSFGRPTTLQEVREAADEIVAKVNALRALAPGED
jgi:cysteine desulfurase